MATIVRGKRVQESDVIGAKTSMLSMIEKITGKRAEACSKTEDVLNLDPINQFVAALNVAFSRHHPITITPDIIWLTLTQGLAIHINENSDSLKKKLNLNFDGKKLIRVRSDRFVRKSPDNNWVDVFGEFSGRIKEEIGEENHRLIVANFSTTDVVSKVASEIVLMNALQSYFTYEVMTMCGIPYLKIEGTVEDWESISNRVGEWEKWDLSWWIPYVQDSLQRIINVVKGGTDEELCNDIYKLGNASGGPYVHGWILTLFPYLGEGKAIYLEKKVKYIKNFCLDWREKRVFGVTDNQFPNSIASVPFVWDYYGELFDYQFVGGISGVEQSDETFMICPKMGWAVQEK